jgi:hypothetical protein
MLKLYKRGKRGMRYWEAWAQVLWVVIHQGKVGERGQVKHLEPVAGKSPEEVIAEAASLPRQKGYTEIPVEEHFQVVVQYRLKTWGSAKDLKRSHKIEDLLNESLGWTGNGHCDGNDIGSGTMNIFSLAVDPKLATEMIVNTLREHSLLDEAVIAVREKDDYQVVYPAGFAGKFSLF